MSETRDTRRPANRKPPPRLIPSKLAQFSLSRSTGNNKIPLKFLNPDRDPDQHRNRIVGRQWDIPPLQNISLEFVDDFFNQQNSCNCPTSRIDKMPFKNSWIRMWAWSPPKSYQLLLVTYHTLQKINNKNFWLTDTAIMAKTKPAWLW